ncbi:Geranylgeranyl transferase type-1 subunit beta [Tolypocladium paradoxum]|uniref:Geranylgeranyl transferase type-1 subunit beta n=1 Tax=Tolypocladium paradoxum TaxID=94208 RepID=A0A2S4KXM3_9HYPO|nr:Geranylgeranyl transferase type-1 subunit beta [Tolypocladium paradoxum]
MASCCSDKFQTSPLGTINTMASEKPQGSEADPWDNKAKQKFETKSKSEFYDPCQEAAQRSYKCLYRNGGDKSMCGEYFQAYRDCKQAWTERRKKENGGKFW